MSACENVHECVLSVHTNVCFHVQKLHGLRRNVRSLSKEFWNLTQVRRDHQVSLSQPPPGAVYLLLCVREEGQLLSGETQLTGE